MPPVKTKTSVGLETPQQTMDRASSLLKRTGFTAKIPDSIPSTAISEGGTFTDVRARRDQMESDQVGRQQFDTDFNNLMGRVQSPLQSSPFQNPEQFINEMLLRRPSETETQLGNVQSEQAQGFRDVGRDLNRTREKLTNEFDIGGLQASLAETRNRIAERTTLLRQSLRDFETNAEKRGVARPFVDAEKQKVQADAAAELADLAIIESAQSGNLQMAREDIDRALDQKIQAFEFENMAIQAEIQRLEKMDSKESEVRSQQLQMALGERNRLVEKAVADERQKLEYLSEAAANGADQGTLDAIRKATNVGEAAMMAGPFIGRLDRMQAQASIANIYDQINSRAVAAREAVLKATTEEEVVQAKREADSEQALSIKALAEDIKNLSGLSSAVGAGFKKTLGNMLWGVSPDAVPGTDRADFEAQATRLANLLTLDNLDLMSGVLSETDIKILETAGSNLRNFNQSEDSYKKEVERIISTMDRTISNNGVTPEQAVYWGTLAPEDVDTFNSIWETL